MVERMMTVFAEMVPPVTMLFIAAVALVTWLLLSRSQRYFSQQRHQEPSSRPSPIAGFEKRGHNLDVSEAAARWEVQMYDTARELSAQLDSKMSALQALIADADRAAARLEAALGSHPPAIPRVSCSQETAGKVKTTGQTESQKSLSGIDLSTLQTPLPSGPAPLPIQDRQRDEIYTLADYGFEPAEIASRVSRPIGEVQLILGLRGKK
jgi:hypothetical protein